MKPLRIFLPSDVLDSYIYSGYLFSVFNDGTLRGLSLAKINSKLSESYPEFKGIFQLAILRNDWLLNPQAVTYFRVPGHYESIKEAWRKASLEDFQVNIEKSEWTILGEIKTMPIHDIHLYAMRIYLANRDGVYEGKLPHDAKKGKVELDDGKLSLNKVFDAPTISISSKAGGLLFSADQDGLFYGSLWSNDKRISIQENQPLAKRSLRTGWSSFDTINYEKHSSFFYIKNTRERKERRPFAYSGQDETSQQYEIVKFGVNTYSIDDLLQKKIFKPEDVQFCFNSSEACFFFFGNGDFFSIYLAKNADNIHLRARMHKLPNLNFENNIGGKPCSASIFPSGSVIEYFDQVILVHSGKVTELENQPVISVRTFPASIRFRRLACITREDGIALHSVFPTDSEIEKKRVQPGTKPS